MFKETNYEVVFSLLAVSALASSI